MSKFWYYVSWLDSLEFEASVSTYVRRVGNLPQAGAKRIEIRTTETRTSCAFYLYIDMCYSNISRKLWYNIDRDIYNHWYLVDMVDHEFYKQVYTVSFFKHVGLYQFIRQI